MKRSLTSPLVGLRPRLALSVGLLALSSFWISLGQAQVIITDHSQTYSVPHLVDGGAIDIPFDFSAEPLPLPGSLVFKTTIAVTFGKFADLSDDPPFFSEIGMTLRKYSADRLSWMSIPLISIGAFNDGIPGSSFNGTLTFDDSASLFENYDPNQIHSGTFRPATSRLSFLNGAFSTFWDLRIDDASAQNPLTFTSATLQVFTAVPESSTVGLCGSFVLFLNVAFRRRKRTLVGLV